MRKMVHDKISENASIAFLGRMGVPQAKIAERFKCSTRTVRNAVAFWADTETRNLSIDSKQLFVLHNEFNKYIKLF